MVDSKYQELVADMGGGVGWRDLRRPERRRPPERDVEITGIESLVVDGNFPWNLIKVETDAGAYGLGEAFPGPASEYIDFLEPGLTGQNPFDVDRLVEHMTQLLSGLGGTTGYSQAAVSGIETALLDVVGKLTGLPVYQLLGGAYRDDVQIYADCHAGSAISEAPGAESERVYDPNAYAEVATDVVDEGFTALKFDLDVEFDDADTATRRLSNRAIDHKVDVVEAVRDAVGDEPLVAFDLHWNFTVETATRLSERLAPFDPDWIEDPVPPTNADAHRKVTETTSVPILAGENLTRVDGFLPFLTAQAVDIIAPDIQKCGGLREFQRIADLAEAYGIPVAPHNISSPVGTMASVHACAAVPNAFVLEWHAREVEWWDDLHRGEEPLIRDGHIGLPEEPGLGIDLDAAVLEANLATGEEMIEL